MTKPDGYAVVIEDPSSPVGFWFAYAYVAEDIAQNTATRLKGKVRPIYFAPSTAAPDMAAPHKEKT